MRIKRKLVPKPSEIHRSGLFSTVEIPKGAIIGKCAVRKVKKPGPHTLWVVLNEAVKFSKTMENKALRQLVVQDVRRRLDTGRDIPKVATRDD